MDLTLKFVLDKVTQLTNRFNSMTQNSKKIHELPNAASKDNVHIAVSDGSTTGKVIYEPSEVSKEEFDNIANLELSNIQNSSIIQIKDSEGNVITSLDLAFLNGNNVTLNIDEATNTLQLLNFEGDVVSTVNLDDLHPKSEEHIYNITAADVASPNDLIISLSHVVKINMPTFLHIQGGFINNSHYTVSGDKLTIHRAGIYPISDTKIVTFSYYY